MSFDYKNKQNGYLAYYKNILPGQDIKVSESIQIPEYLNSLEMSDTPEPLPEVSIAPEEPFSNQLDKLFVSNSDLNHINKSILSHNDNEIQEDLFKFTQKSISEIEGNTLFNCVHNKHINKDIISNDTKSQNYGANTNAEPNLESTTSVKLLWENKTITEWEDEDESGKYKHILIYSKL